MHEFTFTNFAKLGGLVLGVAVSNIFVFSPGLLGLKIDGAGAFQTAFGVTFIVASVMILVAGSYALLFKSTPLPSPKEMKTSEDLEVALSRFKRVKVLEKEIALALNQFDRIKHKKELLSDVLKQRFDESEMSFTKFVSVISSVENLFYLNVKSMINRLNVFYASESSKINEQNASAVSQELLDKKASVDNEYLTFVKDSLNTNEEILLRLDTLLLEISRLDSFELGDIENLSCIQEIDALIKQTKLYK